MGFFSKDQDTAQKELMMMRRRMAEHLARTGQLISKLMELDNKVYNGKHQDELRSKEEDLNPFSEIDFGIRMLDAIIKAS